MINNLSPTPPGLGVGDGEGDAEGVGPGSVDAEGVDAMVFDEIDTGVSGRMAQVVGEKMCLIARNRQVLSITHLPQIAAAADYHYLVSKSVAEGRTVTRVTELDRDGRTCEISRMISGADGITAETKTYASSLLQAAEEMKSQH